MKLPVCGRLCRHFLRTIISFSLYLRKKFLRQFQIASRSKKKSVRISVLFITRFHLLLFAPRSVPGVHSANRLACAYVWRFSPKENFLLAIEKYAMVYKKGLFRTCEMVARNQLRYHYKFSCPLGKTTQAAPLERMFLVRSFPDRSKPFHPKDLQIQSIDHYNGTLYSVIDQLLAGWPDR